MNFTKVAINRLIVHKIFSKKDKTSPYAEPAKELITLDSGSKKKLIERIETAVKKSKRFFETEIDNVSKDSFWAKASSIPGCDKKEFISTTTWIAEKAAEKHDKGYIPGGLFLIIDCVIESFPSIIVIKAELQEAFSLNRTVMKLIKDLFLSPAAELYKIGFLIQTKPNKKSSASYTTYIYDDHFTPKNDDLATYFYKEILGFKTSGNDKLLTNNFHKDFSVFIDKYIVKFDDRRNLKIAFENDLKAEKKGIIDPTDYGNILPVNLQQNYNDEVLTKYNRSFSKDLTLVGHALASYSIAVTSKIKLTASSDELDNIDILEGGVAADVKEVTTRLEAGKVDKVILIGAKSVKERKPEKTKRKFKGLTKLSKSK